jgi:AcrR family transcriptional regulator
MTRIVYQKADVIPMIAEVFRELGFEGASMSKITARTRLSKGSIYYFFPGGKDEMAAEILAHIDQWFVSNIFEPLERDEPRAAIQHMWREIDAYFQSGKRICLVGAFALDETRDRFAERIRRYFQRWIEALSAAIVRTGASAEAAGKLAEEAVGGIQGGLLLSRALHDKTVFERMLSGLAEQVSEFIDR